MSDDVPLLPAEVIGYRVWRIADDMRLRSYVSVHPDADTLWNPGEVTARCYRGHTAPSRHGSGGS